MGARPTHPRLLLPTLISRESSPTLFGWTVQLAVVENHAVIKQLLSMTLESAFYTIADLKPIACGKTRFLLALQRCN